MAKDKVPTVSPDDFVSAWQSSENVGEVAAKTGLDPLTCSARASNYRKKGIKLKQFTPGRKKPLDVEKLNSLIKLMGGEAGPDPEPPPEKSPEEILEDEAKKAKNRAMVMGRIIGKKT